MPLDKTTFGDVGAISTLLFCHPLRARQPYIRSVTPSPDGNLGNADVVAAVQIATLIPSLVFV